MQDTARRSEHQDVIPEKTFHGLGEICNDSVDLAFMSRLLLAQNRLSSKVPSKNANT
jgi:hypothetical protein